MATIFKLFGTACRAGCLFTLIALSFTINAAEHALVKMECQYPSSAGSLGSGTAQLGFESASKQEGVNVTYVLNDVAMDRELRKRATVKWISRSPDHHVSTGNVYTVRNIESRKGLIDNACDEAISLLVAKVQGLEPEDILGVANTELYLINGIGLEGWNLVHKELIDKSNDLSSRVISKYYFSRVD